MKQVPIPSSQTTPLDPLVIKQAITAQPLPIFSQSGHDALMHLEKPNTDVSTLQKILGRDPILCLYVLKNANMVNKKSAIEIKQVDHAINLLGLDRIKRIVSHLPKVTPDPRDVQQTSLLRALVVSIHAAEQAYNWAKLKRHVAPQDVYWATLFMGASHWALRYFLPEAMEMVDHLALHSDMRREKAEKEILGATLVDISRTYQEFWSLPQLAKDCMLEENFPDNRTIVSLGLQNVELTKVLQGKSVRGWLNSPILTVQLANRLAFAASEHWYDRLMARLVSIVAQHLNVTIDEASKLIHQFAVRASHQIPYVGAKAPAAQLLDISVVAAKKSAAMVEASAVKPAKPVAIYYDAQVLNEVMTRWQRRPEQTENLAALMMEVLHAAEKGLKAKRCFIGLLDKQRTHVRVLYSFGYDQSLAQSLPLFSIEAHPMLSALLKSPRSLEVRAGSEKRVPAWPEALHPHIQTTYDIVSIFLGERPVGFYYLDWAGDLPHQSNPQDKSLKHIGRASEYCIRHLAQRRQEQKRVAQS